MNSDELLTQFRSDIPLPDEATAQQVYTRATSARGRLARRGLVLALGAAIVAAIAAVALSGAFGNREGSIPTTGEQCCGGMTVTYSRNGETLSSVSVMLSLHEANARVHLEVLHSDAPSIELYRGKGKTEVVFRGDVSTTDTPPAVAVGPTGDASPEPGWSFWSGTLSPSDWTGGCGTGLYAIQYVTSSSDFGRSEWFRCNGS